jgi:hypothetical protein
MRAVAVIVALAACGGATPRPAALTVTEAGAEPRQPLRYAPVLRAVERAEVRIKSRLSAATTNTVLDTSKVAADAPTIRLVIRSEVTELGVNGDALIGYEIEDTGVLADVVDPAAYRVLEPEVAALKGVRGSWRRSATGQMTEARIDLVSAKLALDSIQQAGAVFPAAAIGVGAVWRSTGEVTISGVRWQRTITYRLKDLVDDVATLEVTAALRASSQALSVEPNASQRLTSGAMDVTGVLVGPLHGIIASGDLRETSELNLLIVRGRVRAASTVRTESSELYKRLAD